MGKWRPYRVGQYRLGQLKGQAVAVWRDEAGRHRIRLDATTEEAGRAALDRYSRRRTVLAARESRTVGELYALYMADRELDGKRMPAFRDNWKALASHFAALTPEQVTADECRTYARNRLRTVSPGTVWSELTRLRSCINWSIKRRLLPVDQGGYVWVPTKPPPKDRVLTVDEARALIDGAVMPHVSLFLWLALLTGARSGALLELTWSRVDFGSGTIDLVNPEPINPLLKTARKSRAVVTMTPELRYHLLEAKAGALSDHVIEWNAAPVASIRKGFAEACKRAGLAGITPHTLRHTHATMALEAGVEIERISRQLGHRDSATTRLLYLHPSADFSAPAATAVNKVLRGTAGPVLSSEPAKTATVATLRTKKT